MITMNGPTDKHRTPLRSIRSKCLDCVGGQVREVRLCPCEHCALWPYRMGTRPGHRRVVDANEDVRREKLRARPGISAPETLLAAAISATSQAW